MKKDVFLREQRHVDHLLTFVTQNWEAMAKAGAPMHLEITDAKEKRSTLANRYYWQTLNQIADGAWLEGRQYSAECWHEHFKGELIGFDDLPGGRKTPLSSSKLSTAEFAAYVTKVEAYGASVLGVQFMEMAS